MNVRRYLEKDAAINFFIKDEKGKVDFVTNIEKEVFRLEGKHVLDIGYVKGELLSLVLYEVRRLLVSMRMKMK